MMETEFLHKAGYSSSDPCFVTKVRWSIIMVMVILWCCDHTQGFCTLGRGSAAELHPSPEEGPECLTPITSQNRVSGALLLGERITQQKYLRQSPG